MKQIHHIGNRWTTTEVKLLNSIGISVEEDVFSYINVESDQFELIKDAVMSRCPGYAFGAEFDKADLNRARWLALTALTAHGYPQPDSYWDAGMVYDVSNQCKRCGLGRGRQLHPFHIKSDKIRLQAFQLEWVYDEIFVKRDLYDEMLAPLEIGFWPVLLHRSGKESDQVVQLDLPKCDWNFDMSGMQTEYCSECDRSKYVVRPIDFLPPLNGKPPNQIFHGREFFGSGAQALKRIYLSQEIRQELLTRKLAKWHQFYPLKPLAEICL